MATEKTPNYSTAQEALILEAIRDNGNVADFDLATKLAADPRMNMDEGKGEARKARGITAKMARMKDAEGFTYKGKQPTTKDGKPVTKKTDLVARIAELSGVVADKLSGLEKAPKLALETLAEYLAEDDSEAA
jgi:hypothetical protein